jgi:integrase
MRFCVFRAKRRVNGKLCVARTWSGEFKLAGDTKPTRVALGVTDKQVAEQKLRRIVREMEREAEGLIEPKEQRVALGLPIKDAIHAFIETRRGLDLDEQYVSELEQKLIRVCGDCGFQQVSNIAGQRFEFWRAKQLKLGKSPKTLNEYRAAMLGFCKWLELQTGRNPMRSVERIKSLGDPKLMQIRWRDIHIDGHQPHISVRSSIAKNAKAVQQPLPLPIASALRQCRPEKVAGHDLVFAPLMPDMDAFRDDLEAAGIPYQNERGEYADFHSLRKTFGTELAKAGVVTRVAMELMRHSDAKLTTRIYTDSGLLPIWDAVGALPMFNGTELDTETLVASSPSVSEPVPPERQRGTSLAVVDEESSATEGTSVLNSPIVDDNGPARIRTWDQGIMSPLL